MSRIKMIFACTAGDYVFGNADKLPWANLINRDMELFREYTFNNILIMGRKTFESLPCKLRNLPHIVISRNSAKSKIFNKKGQNPDAVYQSLDDAIYDLTSRLDNDLCIIGGTQLLKESASIVTDCLMTEVFFTSTEKRYYDAPVYIDYDSITVSLFGNDNTPVCVDKIHEVDNGEVSYVIFTQFTDKRENIIL